MIRVTRNCPWNQCTFCPVYKGAKFSRRPVDHVLKDIESVRLAVEAILQARESQERNLFSEARQFDQIANRDRLALQAASHFVANGMESVFIQDGNSLMIKPEDMISILRRLKEAFPSVKRITSYARSQTVAKISDEDLKSIAEAGLNRIHIGMESGSDNVLTMVKKGVDKATQIVAGQKVKRAGMELSEYYMPGLGGRKLSRENALETADAMNQIDPDFIRFRTLAIPNGAPIAELYKAGDFDKMGDIETAQELLLFLESLEGISSTVKSDHILNLFPEVEGRLPDDKDKMIGPIKEFMRLSPNEQMLFCIGKRTGILSHPTDLSIPAMRRRAKKTCEDLGATIENMDYIVDSITKRFI